MKKMMKNLMLVAAVAMGFTACQSGLDEITLRPTEPEKVTVVIKAGQDKSTRTEFDGEKILWSINDALAVLENSEEYTSTPLAEGGEVATFTVELNEGSADSYTYNAVYPASSYNSDNGNGYRLTTPTDQYPTATSFDPKADLLIAKPITTETQANELKMQFKRIVALGKMSLTDFDNSAAITKVTISSDVELTGNSYVDLANGTVSDYGYTNRSYNNINLLYSTPITTRDIYFTCFPASLTSFQVIVETADGYRYTREVSLTDKSVEFEAGKMTRFKVSMENSTEEFKQTFDLLTDLSELNAGDQIIIASSSSNYAISTTQNSNNRAAASITKDAENKKASFSSDVQILTLENGTKDGTFAFNTGSGYLYAASSSSNHLKTQDNLSDNASWIISEPGDNGIVTITAQGSNTRNILKYNSNSSLFSCYGSGQQDVVIYYKNSYNPIITTDITSKNIDVDGIEDFYITVTATNFNVNDITVESDVEWITVEHEGDGQVLTNVAANDTDTVREGHITISYGTASVVVTYIQSANAKKVSVAEFLAAAEDDTLYELSGTIVNVANTTYGNFDIMDDTGTVYIYGLYSPEGAAQYWAESDAKLGDDIVVRTVRTSHNDTPQGKNAIFVSLTSPGTRVFWTFDNTSVTLNAADGSTATVNVSLFNTTEIPVCTSDNDQFTATYEDGTITITAEENTSTEETITGTITVTCGDLTESITVTQNAALVAGSVVASIDFSAQKYANGQAISNASIGNDVTIVFDKGSNPNSNAPKYYTSGTAIRCYGGNSFTISSSSDKTITITNIELTFGDDDGSNAITTNVGTFTTNTWEGRANSVTFTIGGTSGHRRIKAIEVTYAN